MLHKARETEQNKLGVKKKKIRAIKKEEFRKGINKYVNSGCKPPVPK